MKFHDESIDSTIKFRIHLLNETVLLLSTNSIPSESWPRFHTIINDLVTHDPGHLYVAQMEKLAEEEDSSASGLGLITICCDYGAKLGWKIETDPENNEVLMVNTMVKLEV